MTAQPIPTPSSGRDDGGVTLKPCPFCQQRLELIESWAKSFDPPQLYREYHHRADRECVLGKRHWTFPPTAEKARQAFFDSWNTRVEPTPPVADEMVGRLRAPAYWMSGSSDSHEGDNNAPFEAATALEHLAGMREALIEVEKRCHTETRQGLLAIVQKALGQ